MVFSSAEEALILGAIAEAEQKTSGEIRVFIEDFCENDDPLTHAASLFAEYKMHETQHRNGVLIYLATSARQFAIWGDSGINEKSGHGFWEFEKRVLRSYLQNDQPCEGLCKVIEQIGASLKVHFPADKNNNLNELPDDIIYGSFKK